MRRTILDISTTAQVAVIDSLNFLVGLRLSLHRIENAEASPIEDKLRAFTDRSFLLIDHPRRDTTTRNHRSSDRRDQKTSLEALDHILRSQIDLHMSLVVVPGIDRSSEGWRRELRAELLDVLQGVNQQCLLPVTQELRGDAQAFF